ncbi:MAG TPA: response regulator [Verrucomicrobiae bacterium]
MENQDKVILLVEDSEDDIFLMKRAFKAAGITNPLFVVNDGEAAVDYLSGKGVFANRDEYPYPSLIFLDLKLPYLTGFDVLDWHQKQNGLPEAIFIVISSSNQPTDLNRAYRLGASSYVVKPPTAEQLIDIAKAFRIYWLSCNAFPVVAATE